MSSIPQFSSLVVEQPDPVQLANASVKRLEKWDQTASLSESLELIREWQQDRAEYQTRASLAYARLALDTENETAKAGFYEVVLSKHQITAKLTCTDRVGIHKYTYKNSQDARLIIDLEHRDKLLDWNLSINEDNQLTGSRISSSWANKQFFYFCMDFSSDYHIEYNIIVNFEKH